ncbi:alpha/beta fold hydrolase [Bacillus sp. UNC41MFS5]|uniref:alpha/beta fold hydrolase n=1 Tax=Bacillus sp. UNC41MFS5 TaxID=1449046 RepID=UPI0004796A3A|nr:alpha/beta hydrolase [Bacillus sp. UNC41MFS5]
MFTNKTPAIPNEPNSISSLESMNIGGVDQWVLLRGHDHRKPIILWIHGGPGGAQIGFIRQYCSDLEKDFLIVNYDQRGSGLSFSKNIPKDSMTITHMVEDLLEVVDTLCSRFNQEKVYLLGHSWGTILSYLAITRKPERFHGYFAVSQVVNLKENERISYEYTLQKAKESGNEKAFAQLEKLGAPPWKNLNADRIHNKWLQEFGGGIVHTGNFVGTMLQSILKGPEYRLLDLIRWVRGQMYSMNVFKDELANLDLFQANNHIQVPIVFCCGRHDFTAPSEIAEVFYNQLQAPSKKWMWFEQSAHTVFIEEKEAFIKLVKETVNEWNTIKV